MIPRDSFKITYLKLFKIEINIMCKMLVNNDTHSNLNLYTCQKNLMVFCSECLKNTDS